MNMCIYFTLNFRIASDFVEKFRSRDMDVTLSWYVTVNVF